MKRTFEVEWKDDLGPMWMNQDNLLRCLTTTEHCGEGTIVDVLDVTEESEEK